MKTIKLIDLLIRCLEKDETLPNKIKWKNEIFYKDYNHGIGGNVFYMGYSGNLMRHIDTISDFNREVEIIEDDNKTELPIDINEFNISYNLEFIDYKNIETLKDYLNKDFQTIYDTFDLLIKNQKKLIDIVNELKKEGK